MVQTPHFLIAIDALKQSRLPDIAAIFEDCYRIQSNYFDFKVDKRIRVVLADEDDVANGGAFAAQGWIVIFLPGAQFDIRDQFKWLPNVIAHELGHIITLKKMGLTSKFLGVYLGALHWEGRHFRTGGNISIPKGDIPNWLAEGLAQYSSQICGHDTLGSIRNMVLTSAMLSKELLNFKEMSTFAYDVRKNELVYTQGFAVVQYMYHHFGENKMNQMMKIASRTSVEKAIYKTLRQPAWSIVKNWEKQFRQSIAKRHGSALKPQFPGKYIGRPPFLMQSQTWLLKPSRQWIHTSSHSNDYGITSLYRRLPNHFPVKLYHHVSPNIRLNAAGTKALFIAQKVYRRPYGRINELFELNGEYWTSRQLSLRGRIVAAAYDRLGNVYAIRDNMGRTTIGRLIHKSFQPLEMKNENLEWRDIARGRPANGLFGVGYAGRQSDIYEIDIKSGDYMPVFQTPWQERDPCWDGRSLWFSSDKNGIYNIYSLSGDEVKQWTDVISGAFRPAISDSGLSFQLYTSRGYESAFIPHAKLRPVKSHSIYPPALPPPKSRRIKPIKVTSLWDLEGRKFLGYSVNALYHGHPAQKIVAPKYEAVSSSAESDLDTVFIPKFQDVALGLDFIWLHPGFESFLALSTQVKGNIEKEYDEDAALYLSGLQGIYQNHFKTLNWSNQVYYEMQKYSIYSDVRPVRPVYKAFGYSSALGLPLGRYSDAFALGIIDIGWFEDHKKDKDRFYAFHHGVLGGGLGASYARYEPGQNFINHGFLGNIFGVIIPLGGGILNGGISVYESIFRTFFLNVDVNFLSAYSPGISKKESDNEKATSEFVLAGSIGGTLFLDLPLNLGFAPRKLRGLAIKRAFPFLSVYTQIPKPNSSSYTLKNRLDFHLRPRKNLPDCLARQVSDDYMLSSDIDAVGKAGITLKTLSVFSYPAYWRFSVAYDIFELFDLSADPVWSISLQF